MLDKQWLNRYASTDMRGTAIERSQDRQRKLDGIITWYFDYVMESLPLMLQVSLLLLGCALTRYLWEINITVTSVILGVTSFGVIFYISIVVAGTASESCPYQTPGARILRHIFHHIFRYIRSVSTKFSIFIQNSWCRRMAIGWWLSLGRPWHSMVNFTNSVIYPPLIFLGVIADTYTIGRAMAQSLVVFCRTVYRHIINTFLPQTHGLDQETITLDLRCISWMLQTSLEKAVHLSTLNHLATITTLTSFDPTLVAGCFDAFVSCIKVGDNKSDVVIMQGFEQLATASALSFFNTVSHLFAMGSTSSVLEDVHQRYLRVFPAQADFHGHRFYHAVNATHCLFVRSRDRRSFQWSDYEPSAHEHAIVAHNLVNAAWFKYQRTQQGKVPRWILRFALHSLSLDPLPPVPVVADCLLIIAIDLGCDLSNTRNMALNERCVHV